MLYQLDQKANAESLRNAVQKAKGSDPEAFDKKITWLKNRWRHPADYYHRDDLLMGLIRWLDKFNDELRLMHDFLGKESPFNTAVIADNLEGFLEVYKNLQDFEKNSTKLLKIACLCGSQKVAEYLLKELELNYLSPKCDYILEYVSESNNIEWIKEIAAIMAKTGMEMPFISLHTDRKTIDMVKEVFKTNQPKTNDTKASTPVPQADADAHLKKLALEGDLNALCERLTRFQAEYNLLDPKQKKYVELRAVEVAKEQEELGSAQDVMTPEDSLSARLAKINNEVQALNRQLQKIVLSRVAAATEQHGPQAVARATDAPVRPASPRPCK